MGMYEPRFEAQSQPELTVVIATMGVRDAGETVASILCSATEAEAAVEVIIAWQGTDVPPAPDDPRVRGVDVFPLGLSYARNRGLADARARLVAFVDDDEIVDGGWVRGVLSVFDRTPGATGAFGPVTTPDGRGVSPGETERVFRGRRIAPWFVGTGGNMAFRKDELARTGGFDLRFGAGAPAHAAEEWDLIVRLLREDHTLVWSPAMLVYHPAKTEAEELASRFPYGFGTGQLARRRAYPSLALRYSKAIAEVLLGAVWNRDRRRLQAGLGTVRGFCAGLASRARPLSPVTAIARIPDDLREHARGEAWTPLEMLGGRDPQLRYRGRRGRLLRVYVNPAPGLERELGSRSGIEAVARGRDAVWALGSG